MGDPAASLRARYGQGAPAPGLWNGTLEALLGHRSVRAYLPQPLPDGTLETLVAAAQSASTSSNLQLWSVIAVEDAARKARLSALAAGYRHVARAPLVLVWLLDLARLRTLAQAQGIAAEGLDYVEGFLLGAVDAALAAQNAMVALESLGLGGCYIGAMRDNAAGVAAELALPPHVFALFGMTVGVPDPARPARVKPRLPQRTVLLREQYDAGAAADIADYDDVLKAFQAEAGMAVEGWARKSALRVKDGAALTGRDVLRAFLQAQGFALR